MACRYTYKGRTYEAHEFDDVLRAMKPAEASAFMPSVKAVPDGPFVGSTDAWLRLALKRVVKLAADEGYSRVAFVNGTQSAERYDLSKQVEAVRAIHLADGTFDIRIKPNGQDYRPLGKFTAEKLPDAVGKELAEKIVADAPSGTTSLQGAIEAYKRIYPNTRASDADIAESEWVAKHITGNKENVYTGLDLKVGGEGMRAFYDQIVPKVAKDVLKKLGGTPTRKAVLENPDVQAARKRPTISGKRCSVCGPNTRST